MNEIKRKRLFIDCETSPNLVLTWDIGYNLTIGHENIVRERGIICVCWKWEGENKVHSLTWDKNQSDKEMLQTFIPILDTADEIIGQNHERFDLPVLRTRCIKHNVPMNPKYVTIDTLKEAKYRFRFNSNKLDYMCSFLDIGSKIKTDFSLWKRIVLDKDPKSLKEMVRYCQKDVLLLEKLWEKMNPYIPPKSNFSQRHDMCPECGSTHLVVDKYRTTTSGTRTVSLNCRNCHKFHSVPLSKFYKEIKPVLKEN